MKTNKKKSKFKIFLKNLFGKSKKSLETSNKTEKEILQINPNEKKIQIKDKKIYSYLKTTEQEIYYEKLRMNYRNKPKMKEIKRPFIKKNQESKIKSYLNKSKIGKRNFWRCVSLLLSV